MSSDIEKFQALLATMRNDFVAEIPERCNAIEEQVFALEKSPDDISTFDMLFREIHSLKGSGGTHGLNVITSICHQFENLLVDAQANSLFDNNFANKGLVFIDLLREVEQLSRENNPDFQSIDVKLQGLSAANAGESKVGLVAEASPMMISLYRQALADLPVKLSIEDNGLNALSRLLHERFDFVIVGGELKVLNGIALIAALKASQTHNQKIPAILVSSKQPELINSLGFYAVIERDKNLAEKLKSALTNLCES